MASLDCQVKKETWVPWAHQDLLEDQELQDYLALLDLKVNLDSQAEMVDPVVPELKETKAKPVSRDHLESNGS